jgi:hypothetical protein
MFRECPENTPFLEFVLGKVAPGFGRPDAAALISVRLCAFRKDEAGFAIKTSARAIFEIMDGKIAAKVRGDGLMTANQFIKGDRGRKREGSHQAVDGRRWMDRAEV